MEGKILIPNITEADFYEKYWKYYLSLEKEFFDLSYYVSIDLSTNGKTYSLAYLKLLLAIGSEFDVICKKICKLLDENIDEKACGIDDYKKIFIEGLDQLYQYNVIIMEINKEISEPLKQMGTAYYPDFWNSYNQIKHHRTDNDNIKKANQKTIIKALSSLYIVERIFAFINTTNLSSDSILPNEFNFANFKSKRLYIKEFDSIKVYNLRTIFDKIKKKTNLIRVV